MTATEISRASGKDRRAIHRALENVTPAGERVVDGNDAKAWHATDLPPDLRHAIDPWQLDPLAEVVDTWREKDRPSDYELSRLLQTAFIKLDSLVAAGLRERLVKTRQIKWLLEHVPSLGRKESALRRMFNRLLKASRAVNHKLSAIRDKRAKENKSRRAKPLPTEDADLIVAFTVVKCGGRLDQAWRSCYHMLTAETRKRYQMGREAPKAVRRQLMPDIRRLMPWHIGPRSARLNGAYIERDWSDVAAGDWYTGDDATMPVYYWSPSALDVRDSLTRGQTLLLIDCRSEYILGLAQVDAKSYAAGDVRALITYTCQRHGLPRRGLHFERGIWKKARMLGGKIKSAPWDDMGETFASRLGLELRHALPGNARAKIVERVIGSLQDLMEGEPGYVGRNELVVKYERVQSAKLAVEAGRLHPSEAGFYSRDQWVKRLGELCEVYNAAVKSSRVIGGDRETEMSPDDAWEQLQRTNAEGKVEPLVTLPPDLRYLLAAHVETVRVTRSGISLMGGKYRYQDETTGAVVGEYVRAWLDPDEPDLLFITDMNGENVRAVQRVLPIPAFDASPEQIQRAQRAVSGHSGHARRRYSEIKTRYFPPARKWVADIGSVEKGREMQQERKRVERQRKAQFEQRHAEEIEEKNRLIADFERRHSELLA